MRGRAATRATVRGGVLLLSLALVAAGCGGGPPRQDENEPEGEFEVAIVEDSFPEDQKLAQDSRMTVKVRNTGPRTVPNLNVTVDGFNYKLRDPSDPEKIDPGVADPLRPVFVVEKSPNEFLRDRGDADTSLVDREVNPPAGGDNPSGGDTAFVNNYRLEGPLPPGETATFRWDMSAVEARPFLIRYEVNAGYDGKAVAVTADGSRPTGRFRGVIESSPPAARVSSGDGDTIVTEDGREFDPDSDFTYEPQGRTRPSESDR